MNNIEVCYTSDKNFLVRLKALFNKTLTEAGIKLGHQRLVELTDSLNEAEDYLFASKTKSQDQLALFALHAPVEVPEWFEHVQEPDIPQEPLAEGSELWIEWKKDYRIWEKKDAASRYFQWRMYYGERMIQELNR